MKESAGQNLWVLGGILFTLGVLAVDRSMAPGVAGGVLYSVPVLMGLAVPGRRCILTAAVCGSGLTLGGFYFSPTGGELWTVLVNRFLALFAIWMTAILCLYYRRSKEAEEKLQKAHDELEQRVMERTGELNQYVVRLQQEISERIAAEAKLEQNAEELKRSNRALEDFAAIASHDLQEPLRKVLAFGDQLKNIYGSTLEKRGLDYLNRMQRAAERMKRFIEDLLTFSRVGSKPEEFLLTDLNLLIKEVLTDLEMRIHQTRARIEVGPLPTLRVDQLQMRQLFQNLIGNALKFHKPDGPPCIEVQSENGGGEFKITLQDNGIGFDLQYLEKIFKPFERLHGRSQYEGSGMGLAICRKIVQRHGGEISAHSKKGEGATFIVTLPVKKG